MVLLNLTPLNRENSSRGWPFQGIFGLSQISTHGTLRTRLGDDRDPLLVSNITIQVRCYESRYNKMGSIIATNVLVERSQTLWEPLDSTHQPYAPVGDLDLPFRFVLPPDLPGPSTIHMQDYRVFWRLEAVINHIPLVGLGTRQVKAYDLHLIRNDAPSHLPPAPAFHVASACLPICSYSLSAPSHAVGPEDPIPVSLRVVPTHPGATLVRVTASIERRIEFRGDPVKASSHQQQRPSPSGQKRVATPLPTPPSTASSSMSADEHIPLPLLATPTSGKGAKSKSKELNLDQLGSSVLRATRRTSYFLFSSSSPSTSSPPTAAAPEASQPPSDATFAFSVPTIPRVQPPPSPSPATVLKTSCTTIASAEKLKGDCLLERDDSTGAPRWHLDVPLSLPGVKPGHWSLGETILTPLANVRFFVCVKVTVMTPSSATEVITIPPQELHVVSVSCARREYLGAKLQNKASLVAAAGKSTAVLPSMTAPVRRSSRRLRGTPSRRHTDVTSAEASSSNVGKSSKKRCRERDDAEILVFPSPPPTPADSSATLPLTCSSEVTLLANAARPALASSSSSSRTLRPSRLKIPGSIHQDTHMESPLSDSSSEEDAPFVLSGDLSFQRVARRRPTVPTSSSSLSLAAPRSPKLKHKSSRSAIAPKSPKHASFKSLGGMGRRPSTADHGSTNVGVFGASGSGYQRATSVGAVSPTGVLLLAERMGGLMDVVAEDEHDDASPFSFAPPTMHDSPASVSSSSASTITSPRPPALPLLPAAEREWEAELGRIESSSRKKSLGFWKRNSGGESGSGSEGRRTRAKVAL